MDKYLSGHYPNISIHALREEGDVMDAQNSRRFMHFYPRPPRGGRQIRRLKDINRMQFLSTPSARRETYFPAVFCQRRIFLSTPSARRATDAIRDAYNPQLISIHALREEGDFRISILPANHRIFLSTPSARRATELKTMVGGILVFLSTPSARRATFRYCHPPSARWHFYPRPPRGGRPYQP